MSAIYPDFPQPKPDSPTTMQETNSSLKKTYARHGAFLYPANDAYIGKSLELYGEWSEGEVNLIGHFAGKGACVIEVGSNLGSHTVALGRLVGPEGRVIAFEPQRLIFQILCTNLINNDIYNVKTFNAAVGNNSKDVFVPEIELDKTYNFGGVRIGSPSGHRVPTMSIDSLDLQRVDFIKIDAEDCEPQVLLGAFETINKYYPPMLIEYNPHMREAIDRVLRLFDYRAWSFNEPLFNPGNFKNNKENVFGGTASINLFLSKRPISSITDRLTEVSCGRKT